jgi:hypothetical protein
MTDGLRCLPGGPDSRLLSARRSIESGHVFPAVDRLEQPTVAIQRVLCLVSNDPVWLSERDGIPDSCKSRNTFCLLCHSEAITEQSVLGR